MSFHINDRVVYPAFGIGRVVGVVTKSFFDADSQPYYEVLGERSTVWVQVADGSARGLRRLTRPDELARYRQVVSGQPVALNQDHHQRQLDLKGQMKLGTMQGLCEMVRDLSARSWIKPLNEMDARSLRLSREAVCQEWAAVEGVPLPEAMAEVTLLLQKGRQKFQV